MTDLTVTAIVPAAGLSSRMKEFKPLIKIGGQTLIERVVRLFQAAGVAEVVVVVGHRSDEIISVLEGTIARVVTNPDYRAEMLTSVQVGARVLQGRSDAFFVLPVDIPCIRSMTIRHLMERFSDRKALLCHPLFELRRGHPPLIDSSLIEKLLAWHGEAGLKGFLDEYGDRSLDVPVADAWIRRDVDTDEELAALRRDFERYTIPSSEECSVMLEHYLAVPEAIKAHSRAVAKAAMRIGEVLNAAGKHLNLSLIHASALLHDICKGEKNHADKGAAWLERNGFPEVASIVAEHTDILWKEERKAGDAVDEMALVYLADKILGGERLLTLAERKEAALVKYGQEEAVRQNITARFNRAEKIQSAVEKITGRTLDSILRNYKT